MSDFIPFCPHRGTNQVLTATAASQVASVTRGNRQVRIVNTGANSANVVCYSSLESPVPVASAAEHCVPAGMASIITKDITHDRIAYISATGTTLQVSTGNGG